MNKYLSILASLVLLFACSKESDNVRVSGVSFKSDKVYVLIGQTIQLRPSIRPGDASDKGVSWKSEDEAIATVDDDGTVHGIKVGEATIKVTTHDGGKTAICKVVVEAEPVAPSAGTVSGTTCFTATIGGEFGVGLTHMGVLYSTFPDVDESNSQKLTTNDFDANRNYSISITGLEPATTYYYRSTARYVSYLSGKAQDYTMLSEVKSFTTKSIEATINTKASSNVFCKKATLNGNLSVATTEEMSKSVWFLYSTSVSTLSELKSKGKKVDCTLNEDGSFSTKLESLTPGTFYYYVAVAKLHNTEFYGSVMFCKTQEIPSGAVDLGLSVLWATSNLGTSGLCSNPQDYGSHYAWGETSTKSDYSWSTYKWGSSETSLTKYNTNASKGTVDNKTELKDYNYEDDVARVKLGGSWRIPTKEEWAELRQYCSSGFVTNYKGTDAKGVTYSSLVSGYKDNEVFFPYAGGMNGSTLYNRGIGGGYWSSTADNYSYPGDAWLLLIYYSETNKTIDFTETYRCMGHSVRPVLE